jgi:hypothetical protein
VPSYSTFFDTTCPFLCVFMHKTPHKSHSRLASLGLLCLACVRVRLLTHWLTLHARDTGQRWGGVGGHRFPILVGKAPILPERSFLLTQIGSKVYQYILKEKCTNTFYLRNSGGKFVIIGIIFLVGGIFLSVVYFRFVAES